MQRLDDSAYYKKKGVWNFSSSVNECVPASKQGIKDLGYKILDMTKKRDI
jgi:hypothetical protein